MNSKDNSLESGYDSPQHSPTLVTGQGQTSNSPASENNRIRDNSLLNFKKIATIITSSLVLLILLVGGGTLIFDKLHKSGQISSHEANGTYKIGSNLSLGQINQLNLLKVGQDNKLAVNGQLTVNKTLVITPSSVPSSPVVGEIYYNQTNNQPYFYNGTQFVSLMATATPQPVLSIGGISGVIGLGGSLTLSGGILNVSSSVLQSIRTLQANPNASNIQGSNSVTTSSTGSSGYIAKFTGANTLADSSIIDNGTQVTVSELLSASTISTSTIQSTGPLNITPSGSLSIDANATTIQGGLSGVYIQTNSPSSGTSGNINLETGNSSTGTSGNITIDAGSNVPTGTTIEHKGFETSTDNMDPWFNSSVAQSTAKAHTGTHSLAVTATASGSWGVQESYPGTASVTAGHTYGISSWFLAATTPQSINLSVKFINAGGIVTGMFSLGNATDNTSSWVEISGNVVAPASSATIEFIVSGVASNAGEIHYIDDMTVIDYTATVSPSINIGTANAQSINIGNNNQTAPTTVLGGGGINIGTSLIASPIQIGSTSSSSTQIINIGNNATAGSTSNTTIGSIAGGLVTLQSSGVAQSVSGSSDIVQTLTNSTSAFQVQNASGASMLTVDTTNQRVDVGTIGTPSGQLYVSGNMPTSYESLVTNPSISNDAGIAVQGNYLYVAGDYGNNLITVDISNPNNLTIIGTSSLSDYFNGITVSGNYAYVTVDAEGTNAGEIAKLDVFNISNPTQYNLISSTSLGLGTTPDASGIIKYGNYVYVYCVNSGTTSGTLDIFNIANPSTPVLVNQFGIAGGELPSFAGMQNGMVNGIQYQSLAIEGSYMYIAGMQSNELQVLNISNPAAPTVAGSLTGLGGPVAVAVSGRYAYVTNYTSGTLGVVDISNPTSPSIVGTVIVGNSAYEPDGIYLQGHYAYVPTYGPANLYTINISNPTSPSIVSYVNTTADGGQGPVMVIARGLNAYVENWHYTGNIESYYIGGEYTQQLQTGGAEIGSLQVDNNASFSGNINLNGGLSVAGTTDLSGNTVNSGQALFESSANSVSALQAANSSGQALFNVNTVSNSVDIAGLASPTAVSVGAATAGGTLTASTTYYIEVAAVNGSGGESAPSNVVTGETGASPDLQLPITWNAVPGAVSYDIYYSTTHISPGQQLAYYNSATNSYTLAAAVGTAAIPPSQTTFADQFTSSGTAIFQSTTNSTTAFEVQNASGDPFFNINTSSNQVCIGAITATCTGSETLGVIGTIVASSTIAQNGSPDYAEDITATYPGTISAGNLVSADPNHPGQVVLSSTAYDPNLIGAISTHPGFVANAPSTPDPSQVPIALVGRIPVKVNTENGPIAVGDYITSSNTPGVGMKATLNGPVIGVALASYNGSGTGTILVYIENQYYSPTSGTSIQGNGINSQNLQVSGQATLASLTVTGDVSVTGNLTVSGMTTVQDLTVDGHIITSGSAPTVTALTDAGINAMVTINGNDTIGTITITTGSQNTNSTSPNSTAGDLVNLLFNKAFGKTPHILLSPDNAKSAALLAFPDKQNTNGFDLSITNNPSANTTYQFEYFVAQ